MMFEFIIVYQRREGEAIKNILCDRLREVLEANLNDVDEDACDRMILTSFERTRPTDGNGPRRAILGFSLDLADDTTSIRDVVDQFAEALMVDPIEHAVKCEDPLLRAELATRAEELFAVEMKLRRVLTIIYLHAVPGVDYYDLLREESVQPMASAKPQAAQMKARAENQFFHLTFGQYVGLNQRPAIKDLAAIIRNEGTYEAFRAELLRQPVEHEDDAGFLAGLKERMDAIEKMRNAVAHNRRPSQKTINDYLNALPLVNQALDEYLSALITDWRDVRDVYEEMLWDAEARKALERSMEVAEWDEGAKTITLYDTDEPRRRRTVSNRDELVQYLEDVARTAFYANCPREDGEFVYECGEESVVEGVLIHYEERLANFFD
jgi:hypothetical protein